MISYGHFYANLIIGNCEGILIKMVNVDAIYF